MKASQIYYNSLNVLSMASLVFGSFLAISAILSIADNVSAEALLTKSSAFFFSIPRNSLKASFISKGSLPEASLKVFKNDTSLDTLTSSINIS